MKANKIGNFVTTIVDVTPEHIKILDELLASNDIEINRGEKTRTMLARRLLKEKLDEVYKNNASEPDLSLINLIYPTTDIMVQLAFKISEEMNKQLEMICTLLPISKRRMESLLILQRLDEIEM